MALAPIGATRERTMSQNHEAEIAAFIRAKGVTRCPTACAAPTHASGNAADRAALRCRAAQFEVLRQDKARQAWARVVAAA